MEASVRVQYRELNEFLYGSKYKRIPHLSKIRKTLDSRICISTKQKISGFTHIDLLNIFKWTIS
jgi:hypothetical protein